MAAINGRSIAEHLGRAIREVVPDVADKVEPIFRRVFRTGEPALDHKVHGYTAAEPQTRLDWLVSYHPLESEAGSVEFVSAVVLEITGRKRAEIALRESEEQYRLLVEHTGMPITIFDREGRCLFSNQIAAQNLGLTPEGLVGKTLHDLFPKEAADRLVGQLSEILDTGIGIQTENLLETTTGKRWFWSILQPVQASSGGVPGVQIVSRDLTERKLMKEALAESEAKNRAILNAIPDLMFRLGHEGRVLDFSAGQVEDLAVPPEQ
ncbi:unnamed protein product, partial [marine sediment metagenome]